MSACHKPREVVWKPPSESITVARQRDNRAKCRVVYCLQGKGINSGRPQLSAGTFGGEMMRERYLLVWVCKGLAPRLLAVLVSRALGLTARLGSSALAYGVCRAGLPERSFVLVAFWLHAQGPAGSGKPFQIGV